MAIGPGKYDDVCEMVREKTGGYVALIVMGGNHGNGFSVIADYETSKRMPDILEYMAKEIRKDVVGLA